MKSTTAWIETEACIGKMGVCSKCTWKAAAHAILCPLPQWKCQHLPIFLAEGWMFAFWRNGAPHNGLALIDSRHSSGQGVSLKSEVVPQKWHRHDNMNKIILELEKQPRFLRAKQEGFQIKRTKKIGKRKALKFTKEITRNKGHA